MPWLLTILSSFYLTKILSQAGITNPVTQTQVQVIINCWSFAVAIFGSFMLDVLGRRIQTFIGVGGMTATLLLIGGLIKRESFHLVGHMALTAVDRLWREHQYLGNLWHNCCHFCLSGLLRLLHHAHDKFVPNRGVALQAPCYRHCYLPYARFWIWVSCDNLRSLKFLT